MEITNIVLASLMPTLIELLGLVLGAALLRLSFLAKRYFGIQIEAKHRDALHSALLTGAQLAMAKGLKGPAAVSAVLDHVTGPGAKQAVEIFRKTQGLTGKQLEDMAKGKIEELLTKQVSNVAELTVDKLAQSLRSIGLPAKG